MAAAAGGRESLRAVQERAGVTFAAVVVAVAVPQAQVLHQPFSSGNSSSAEFRRVQLHVVDDDPVDLENAFNY